MNWNVELRAITASSENLDSSVMMSSVMPSLKYSCCGSPLRFENGNTAMEGASDVRDSKPAVALMVGGVAAAAVASANPRMLLDRDREAVSSAWHGFDDFLVSIGDGLAHFADATRERLVGHDHVRPDRLDQFVFGHQAPGILDQTAQHLEALGTQIDFAIGGPQRHFAQGPAHSHRTGTS